MKISFTISITLLFALKIFAQPGYNLPVIAETQYIATEKKISHKIGDRNITVKVFQYGEQGNIICINLHDNENASVEAAKSIFEQKGGTLIKIENNKQRVIRFRQKGNFYSFDPNRIFSKIGIEQTLKVNHKFSPAVITEVEKFAQKLLSLIPDSSQCVIALHNNTDGAFSIRSYMPGGNRMLDAKAIYSDSLQDIDDIILTTDSLLFQKMAKNGYNSIWQDNTNAKKDGSLSIYFGELNRRYINIETQHGKVVQYAEMLDKLLAILKDDNKIHSEIPKDSL